MAWKERNRVDERRVFIERLLSGERMSDLCCEFQISRKTGYKLLHRYNSIGPLAYYDMPRTPKNSPKRVPDEIRELYIALRKKRPTWGPKKLRAQIAKQHPGVRVASASAIGDWLAKAKLTKPRRRQRKPMRYGTELHVANAPNDIWCVDFKGQFLLGNQTLCYPLTVTDEKSRFILACIAFDGISTEKVVLAFIEIFERYGLPKFMRSDNGAPFASVGLWGLSVLSVFWLKHGITPERISPGRPQQNGKHERMHRTLKEETTRPAAHTLLAQQERFDAFTEEYNTERPHEALGMKTPREIFTASSTAFEKNKQLLYPLHDNTAKVTGCGHAAIPNAKLRQVFLGQALAYETVGLRELENGEILVTFAHLDLGLINPNTGIFHSYDIIHAAEQKNKKSLNKRTENK